MPGVGNAGSKDGNVMMYCEAPQYAEQVRRPLLDTLATTHSPTPQLGERCVLIEVAKVSQSVGASKQQGASLCASAPRASAHPVRLGGTIVLDSEMQRVCKLALMTSG